MILIFQYTFPGTQFLTFEHVTLVPYEPNLINLDLLSDRQVHILYHYFLYTERFSQNVSWKYTNMNNRIKSVIYNTHKHTEYKRLSFSLQINIYFKHTTNMRRRRGSEVENTTLDLEVAGSTPFGGEILSRSSFSSTLREYW